MKRISAYIALLAMAAIICACGNNYEKTPTPVRVNTVASGELPSPLKFTATVNPYSQVGLDFKVDGYVRKIHQEKGADGRMRDIQEGDEVVKGMALASIDDTEYASKLIEAKSQLGAAQASYIKSNASRRTITTGRSRIIRPPSPRWKAGKRRWLGLSRTSITARCARP